MMRSWEGTLHGTAEGKLSAEVIATMFVCSTNDVWCCDGPKTTAEEVVVNWLMNRLMNEGSVGTVDVDVQNVNEMGDGGQFNEVHSNGRKWWFWTLAPFYVDRNNERKPATLT
ncbi:MAG: hypothetical protein ACTS43_00575 [Candidatus Hodgkinia cicadicola]